MRLPHAAEPATAATVNRLPSDSPAGITSATHASKTRRQRLSEKPTLAEVGIHKNTAQSLRRRG
jgi:hypothetical protein